MKCNGVFEGGGVLGIGHAGAAAVFESQGYCFENVCGSSAGAIAAALIAAGYNAKELFSVISEIDYKKFQGENIINRLGAVGDLINILFSYGIYDANYFEAWMEEKLRKKGVYSFGDLKKGKGEKIKYKLQVTASDLTSRTLLTLPNDAGLFGISPDALSVAKAVRMSMSIPLYYKPFALCDKRKRKHYIVDGGLLSNYPVWMLDDGSPDPSVPTFGFKFIEKRAAKKEGECERTDIVSYLKSIVDTLTGYAGECHVSMGDMERSVFISPEINADKKAEVLKATNFDITREECLMMYDNGRRAAEGFLKNWNFDKWKEKYRKGR